MSEMGMSREALAFAPGLLGIQESPPAPLPRWVLYSVAALFSLMVLWSVVGKLDVIVSADGRLVPQSYLKIVQPADAGIVKEILVREGETVTAGQVLVRMDAQESEADTRTLATDLALKSLQLRRIDAELNGTALKRLSNDPSELYDRVRAQFDDHRRAYEADVAQAQEGLDRAEQDDKAGVDTLGKLRKTNPLLQSQAQAYEDLGRQGYAAQVLVNEKQRAYLENDQDLQAQEAKVASLEAAVEEARQQVASVTSKYRSDLQNERIQAEGELNKLQQDVSKQSHKNGLLELRAPQSGIVKDLATHTVGSVVSAGTIILSLVPEHEPFRAEVVIRNEDVGFVHAGQAVQVKLAAYPFQKYGMLQGTVLQIWPDAAESSDHGEAKSSGNETSSSGNSESQGYRALIELQSQTLAQGGTRLELMSGMRVAAEINEGKRSALEYLLSPVEKVLQEGGRER